MPTFSLSPGRWSRWLGPLVDLFYPPRCVACGQFGAWLCGTCRASIPSIEPPICSHCGRHAPRKGLCAQCRETESFLAGIRSVAPHDPPLREAIHALKYGGQRVLAEPLALLLAQHWHKQDVIIDTIVPVPLHPRRERQRGYNQSQLLASALAGLLQLSLDDVTLVRQRATRSQVGLSTEARRANVWGAFACRSSALCARDVLLVDDVFTTGATLEACAHALLMTGANTVWALTLTAARDSITPVGDV